MKRLFIASLAIFLTVFYSFARQPERGYRGFVDLSGSFHHWSDGYWNKTCFDPGISTSHGYQFNPWLFAGAGIDFSIKDAGFFDNHYYDILSSSNFVALFVQGRTDLQFGKFTPFADIRLGWNASSSGTVYFSPSVGYRFNWGRKVGINLGVGYTLYGFRYDEYKMVDTIYGYQTLVPTGRRVNKNLSSFTLRLGIDF